jgi:hypothetical protein
LIAMIRMTTPKAARMRDPVLSVGRRMVDP